MSMLSFSTNCELISKTKDDSKYTLHVRRQPSPACVGQQ